MSKVRYAATALAVVAALVAGTARFEGKENDAYVDKLARTRVVTVCYGHTRTAVMGQHYTDSQCSALLLSDLEREYAPIVRRLVKVPLSQGEFNALVDFVYNLGEPNFRSSTLLKKLNAGDYAGAQAEFIRWNKTNGKDCRIRANKCYGIIERRLWETKQFAS